MKARRWKERLDLQSVIGRTAWHMRDGWYEIGFGEGLDRLSQGTVAGLISTRVWGR